MFAFHYYINGVIAGFIAYQRNTNTIRMGQTDATVDEVEIDKSGRWLVQCCFPYKDLGHDGPGADYPHDRHAR